MRESKMPTKKNVIAILAISLFTFQFGSDALAQPTPGTVIWEYSTGGMGASSPAVAADGTVYIGSLDHNIYALDGTRRRQVFVNGKPHLEPTKKWEFKTGSPVQGSVAIGPGGTIYVGSNDDTLYALHNQTGHMIWKLKREEGMVDSPSIGIDGTIYIGSAGNSGKVYALDGKSGLSRWKFTVGNTVHRHPAIASDGTIYVGTSTTKVFALDGRTGDKKWEFAADGMVPTGFSAAAIGVDGTIYIGTEKKYYALDGKSGAKKWDFETGEKNFLSSPTIGDDGTVYVTSKDGKVYGLDAETGARNWEYYTGKSVYTTPAIGSDGTVYVMAYKRLLALDGRTGAKRWQFSVPNSPIISYSFSSPTIGPDGTLYVAFNDGKLFAIVSGSKGPAKSPWPMLGQNPQHTGRAAK